MTKNFELLWRKRQARQMYSEFHAIAKPRTLPASREKSFHGATEPLPVGSYRRKIIRPLCGNG
jgi:hypothetical protein